MACWGGDFGSASAQTGPLLPLNDPEAVVPIAPAGLSRNVPELYGNYAQIWELDSDTQVIQYYGDFALHLGDRRLKGQEAVVWMQKSRWQAQTYYHYDVYLSQKAQVRDAGGTLTSGPELFVTFNSVEPPLIAADVTDRTSSADTKLYREATKTRQSLVLKPGRTTAPAQAEPQPGEMEVVDLGAPRLPEMPKVRPLVYYRADEEARGPEDKQIITATGHVYLSQGLVESGDFLEIRADSAVLFLAEPSPGEAQPAVEPAAPGLEPFPRERVGGAAEGAFPGNADELGMPSGLSGAVAGVYLEGDVVLTRGERMIRASRLYYDFKNDRALILDAVMRAVAPSRDVPIYVRAAQVRQLSNTEYEATKAAISASEFHTPHVHLGAERVHLTDLSPRDESGRVSGIQAGRYRANDVTLNLDGVPIAYWPYATGDFRESETAIRSVRMAYSDDFGATFQSKWYLFNLLGIEKPQGVDALLRMDYFSDRGPGAGLDVDYETEDAFGLFRGYYINDTGEDSLGPIRSGEPDTENRGRITWRHRQLLGQGWELTLEGSYISDPNFLEEYFTREFEQGKDQETAIYLKKQQDNWAFTSLMNWRVLDWLTQTEHLPDVAFHWIGEPLAEIGSFYSETHAGLVRYRPDERRLWDTDRVVDNTNRTDVTVRGDTRNEVDFPIKLGDFNLVPYAVGRPGYWDGAYDGGAGGRLFGSAGVRGATQFWKLFEGVTSELLDVHGVRHIIRPEVTAWASASNRGSWELHPFDPGIETIDDFYGTSLAVRQKWQTKRGGPGNWTVVDWITFDVELNMFGDTPKNTLPIGRYYDWRPEESVARPHVRTDFMYRISDTTAVLSDTNFDLNDGTMDLFNISYAVERTPRLSYFFGYRRIHDTDSNLIGFGTNYQLNSKYSTALRTYYDIERSELEEFDISIIRKWPRWYTAITFGLDNIDENISLGFTLWPEGAPRMALGDKRLAAVAESTGIRPEE